MDRLVYQRQIHSWLFRHAHGCQRLWSLIFIDDIDTLVWPQWWSFADVSQQGVDFSKTRLKVNPRPRVGRLKIRLRPCQDHDWPAMSGPCLTRPCCQDYFKTISRPCLTRPCLSRPCLSRPYLTRPCLSRPCLSRPFWQDLVFRYHVMTNLIHFVHWASLDQISPFGSDLIKFDQVWSSLNEFELIWTN
jgi:hypothetical protein